MTPRPAPAPYWATSVTPIGPPASENPTVRQLLYAGVVTGAWAGIACLIVYLLSRAFGVDFTVTTDRGSVQIPWVAALVVPLISALAAALLSSLVRGWPRAGGIVYAVGTLVTVVSMAWPVLQGEGIPTKVMLIVMHVIAWWLIVPKIARIVGDSEPGRSVERGE